MLENEVQQGLELPGEQQGQDIGRAHDAGFHQEGGYQRQLRKQGGTPAREGHDGHDPQMGQEAE